MSHLGSSALKKCQRFSLGIKNEILLIEIPFRRVDLLALQHGGEDDGVRDVVVEAPGLQRKRVAVQHDQVGVQAVRQVPGREGKGMGKKNKIL